MFKSRGLLLLVLGFLAITAGPVLAGYPSSTNYELKSYSFGNGGTSNSTSTNYALNATAGEQSGGTGTSTNYNVKPGVNNTQQANVPNTPTLTNPGNSYDKLTLIIDNGSNPTDTLFDVAISTDNFVTTQYVKNDNTVEASPTFPTDYRTYSGVGSWGGATGVTLIGLIPSTTYYVKVQAYSGKFTQSGFSPVASAATVGPQLTFCLYTGANCAAAGNTVTFSGLTAGTVSTGLPHAKSDFATNADNGGGVYLFDSNNGLSSAHTGSTLAAVTADLTTNTGYGVQGVGSSQTSGGPFSIISPFNVSGNNVAAPSTTVQQIYSTANPVVGGTAQFQVLAKPSSLTPASNDYTDTITMVAAAQF